MIFLEMVGLKLCEGYAFGQGLVSNFMDTLEQLLPPNHITIDELVGIF